MIREASACDTDHREHRPLLPRLFLREPGWRVGQKLGSDREFCHQYAPGEQVYHRLSDGEIYVYCKDEKLCLPCADRRGLLADEPKGLKAGPKIVAIEGPARPGDTFRVIEPDADSRNQERDQ